MITLHLRACKGASSLSARSPFRADRAFHRVVPEAFRCRRDFLGASRATAIAAASIFLFAFGSLSAHETIVGWDLTGSSDETEPPTTVAPGVTGLDLAVGPGINASGLANGFSANGFNRSNPSRHLAIDEGMYFEFGFTVEEGNRAFLATLDTAFRRSALWGPLHLEWHYSLDGFATPGIPVPPAGAIWDDIGWEPNSSVLHGTREVQWTGDSFVYRGRNSGAGSTDDRSHVENYNYMSRDVSVQGANGIPGNPMPTIDLRGISDLQGVPAGTTVTFRLYVWGDADEVTPTNSFALGRYDGPVVRGAVSADDEIPLTVLSEVEGTDPEPGIHLYPEGTEVTLTAPDVIEEDGTRYILLGWTSTGSAPADDGSSVTFTLDEGTTLEWEWVTQNRLEVTADGEGTVELRDTLPFPLLGFDFSDYTRAHMHEDGVPASMVADQVNPSTIIRGTGISARNLAIGGMSSDNWTGAASLAQAIETDKYLEFDVSPAGGESVDVAAIYVPFRYSVAASDHIALLYSIDDFNTYSVVESMRIQDQVSGTEVDRHLFVMPDDPDLQDVTDGVTFRLYGWGGTGGGTGTFALYNERGSNQVDMIVFGGLSESSTITGTGGEELWLDVQSLVAAEAEPSSGNMFTGWSGRVFSNHSVLRGLKIAQPRDLTAHFAADSDGDGIPDDWKMHFFGDLSAGPDEDPDEDGFTNLEEYLRGTDPTVAEDLLSDDGFPSSIWENTQRDPHLPGQFFVYDFGDGFRGVRESSGNNRGAMDPFRPDGEPVTAVPNVSFDGPRMIVRDEVWDNSWDEDAVIAAEFSVGDDEGTSVYFRYQDELNWYRVTVTGQESGAAYRPDFGVWADKRVDGEYHRLGQQTNMGTDPEDDQWFKRVRVVVEQDGPNFVVTVSGWEEEQEPPDFDYSVTLWLWDQDLEWGRAGIGTWNQGGGFQDAHPDWNPVNVGTLFERFTVEADGDTVIDDDWSDQPLQDELPAGWENPFEEVGGLSGYWRNSAHGTLVQTTSDGNPTSGTDVEPRADADGPVLLAPAAGATTYALEMGFHPFHSGAVGFVFDYQDESNYGRVLFAETYGPPTETIPSGVVVSRKTDGVWTDQFIGDRDFVYRPGQPFHVSFSRAGTSYTMTAREIDNPDTLHRWKWEDDTAAAEGDRHGLASWQLHQVHFLYADVYGVIAVGADPDLSVTSIERIGGNIVLGIDNPSGDPYDVQRTVDLGGSWETVDTNQTSGTWSGSIPPEAERVFWRLVR